MLKHLLATATITMLVASASTSFATTTVGGATLIDNATVINGTVAPTTYLSYVSGGNGLTGVADGTNWAATGESASQAMSTADHHWLQFDPGILMHSANAISSVIAIPALDHGWTAGNTGEFWEPFEFRIFGCTGASTTACSEEGRITKVWTLGVDNTGSSKNADDWTTEWSFNRSYNYFAIVSGDRLVGGCYSCGEGEIDALAVGQASVPEPSSMLLLGSGLVGLALRFRKQAK